MKPKFILYFLLTLFICLNSNGQTKTITAKGEYCHKNTNSYFPLKIDNYNRGSIISYNNSKENISVTYSNQTTNGKTIITISIYPAGPGTEGRLRKEFLSSLSAITYVNKTGNKIQKFPIEFKKNRI